LQQRDWSGTKPAVLRELGARGGIARVRRNSPGSAIRESGAGFSGAHRVPNESRRSAGRRSRAYRRVRRLRQRVLRSPDRGGSEADGGQGGGDVLRVGAG